MVESVELEAFFKRYSLSCCAEFREFLLAFNGGKPEPNEVGFIENGNETSTNIKYFLGIHHGPSWAQLEFFLLNDRLESGYYPIAYDDGGNCFVIKNGGEAIYFEDHETQILHFVANSFHEFINLVQKKAYDTGSVEEAMKNDDVELLRVLISKGEVSVLAENEFMRLFTEEAAIYGAKEILKYLVVEHAVPLRRSSAFAQKNKNKETVELIKKLKIEVQ